MKCYSKILLFLIVIITPIKSMASIKSVENEDAFRTLVSLFFDAARTGNNEVIQKFVDAGFPVNEKNHQSYTALMVAAYQGQKDTVKLLLKEGANACIEDKRGNTAFMGALLKREIEIAKRLYQADCSYDESRNKAGLNVEEFAALFGQAETLKMLNEESGVL